MERIRSHLLRYGVTVLLAACSGGSDTPTIAPLTVTPTMASVMVDQQIQLAATVRDAMGNVVTDRVVTWTSSNTAVATVDSGGLVKALTLGQVAIIATSEGNSGTAALTTTTGLLYWRITAGGRHTCGIAAGGNTYCWGDNTSGQLGNATTTSRSAPVLVAGGLPFVTLSAGDGHTCGVTHDGLAYCWGDNTSGQLGNGTTTNSGIPVLVEGAISFKTVSAGGHHTCGITQVGTAYCWGNNSAGQLGNGTTVNSAFASPVAGGISFRLISSGGRHTCGASIEPTGSNASAMLCWGDNSVGQLGNGTTTNATVPVAIQDDRAWVALSAGENHTCADWLTGGRGRIRLPACWGGNGSGQLGDGTTIDRLTPQLGFASVYVGEGSAGTRFTCGFSLCSGDNTYGQLGNGTTTNSVTPAPVGGGLSFEISAGGRHACGMVRTDPPIPVAYAVYCWGDNSHGQLGNGWTTMSTVPVNVAGGE